MKYIRTQNGIKKVFRKLKNGFYLVKESQFHYNHYFPNCKVADTIEELCDWFVLKIDGKLKICYDNLDNAFACEGNDIGRYEIYGALDTDKGLIYVAKMNESGVLELL